MCPVAMLGSDREKWDKIWNSPHPLPGDTALYEALQEWLLIGDGPEEGPFAGEDIRNSSRRFKKFTSTPNGVKALTPNS